MSQVMLQDHKFGLARYVAGTLICSTVWQGTAQAHQATKCNPLGAALPITALTSAFFAGSHFAFLSLEHEEHSCSNYPSFVINFTQEPQ
jgi:hypothetical protein